MAVLYWFYRLWFADADESQFRTSTSVGRSGATLGQAGIQLPALAAVPGLGTTGDGGGASFEVSNLKLVVKQTPEPLTPVTFMLIAMACTSRVAVRRCFRSLRASWRLRPAGRGQRLDPDAKEDLDKTLRPGGKGAGHHRDAARSMGQEARLSNSAMPRRLARRARNDFMSDSKEVARHKARLAHLCRLIVRDRQPFCAANGILVLIPLAGTDTPLEAQLTAQACQDDLLIARQEMKLDCPVVSMVVDMEQVPGFSEFMLRQPPKELGNRRGNGFPMATRLPRGELVEEIRTSLHWVCTTYLQDSVYRIFQSETPTFREALAFFPENSHLFILLDE